MTKKERMRDNVAVIASTTPSAMNSCSGSFDMLSNGSTAIDGLSGNTSCERAAGERSPAPSLRTWNARTGWAMFFTLCSPWSWKANAARLRCAT